MVIETKQEASSQHPEGWPAQACGGPVGCQILSTTFSFLFQAPWPWLKTFLAPSSPV